MKVIKLEVELQPFIVPNYVNQKTKCGKRQDGLTENPTYHLSELSDEVLHELCDQFRESVLAKAFAERNKL